MKPLSQRHNLGTDSDSLTFKFEVSTVKRPQIPPTHHAQITPPEQDPPPNFSIPSGLLDPMGTGDIVFHLHEDKDTSHQLYASRKILEDGSEYFAASNSYLTLH
jgi:hypothetical protein